MRNEGIKQGAVITGDELLTKLGLRKPVYMKILGQQFCPYLEVTRESDSTYVLVRLWETNNGTTMNAVEEVDGSGEVYLSKVVYSDEMEKQEVKASEVRSHNTEVREPTVNDLYTYSLETYTGECITTGTTVHIEF